MSTTWVNGDGLVVYFGTREAQVAKIGEYNEGGSPIHFVEVDLKYTDLSANAAATFDILNDTVKIPSGVYIEAVEIITVTNWDSAGDAVTIDVGTVDADDRTTEHDFDGFVVAATQSEMNTGGKNVAGWKGALVGTVLSNDVPLLITADQDAADATAGRSTIRIYYSYPNDN